MDTKIQELIERLLKPITSTIAPNSTLEFTKEGDQWRIVVHNGNGLLIGEKGEVIKSIQHFLRIAVHHNYPEDRTHFLIDVGSFRASREKIVKQAIPEIASERVLASGQTVMLIGLTGYERMLVHQLLADVNGLKTNSVGPKHDRKLLIQPTSETGASNMETSYIWDINKFSENIDKA